MDASPPHTAPAPNPAPLAAPIPPSAPPLHDGHIVHLDPRAKRNQPGTNHYAYLAIALLLLVAYGSLIPLKFRSTPPRTASLTQSAQWMWDQLQTPTWITEPNNEISSLGISAGASDLVTNLLLYFPAALLLNLALRRRFRAPTSAALALATIALTSYTLETAQSLMAFRVSSLNDVTLNSLGAIAGVLLAAPIHNLARKLAFFLYCRAAHLIHTAQLHMLALVSRPSALAIVVFTNFLLAILWLIDAARRTPATRHTEANWLPFYTQWLKSYDLAALQIARSLAIYGGIALLIALQLLPTRTRVSVAALALITGLLATAREFIFIHHRGPDVTEPLLALLAAGLIASALALTRHAIHSSNRRKQSAPLPVPHDRRRHRHRHNYESA